MLCKIPGQSDSDDDFGADAASQAGGGGAIVKTPIAASLPPPPVPHVDMDSRPAKKPKAPEKNAFWEMAG